MGDRSNIYFRNGNVGIGVYAHWGGTGVAAAAAKVAASEAFRRRIGDANYATRIGVQIALDALGCSPTNETGFGLWPKGSADDNSYPYVVIDVNDGAIYVTLDVDALDAKKRVTGATVEAMEKAIVDAMRSGR
jgi:hypothetical protein